MRRMTIGEMLCRPRQQSDLPRRSTMHRVSVGDILATLSDRDRSKLVLDVDELSNRAAVEGASDSTIVAMIEGYLSGVAYRTVIDDHGHPCHCESFSDCYKSVTGIRPRWQLDRNGGNWSCARIAQWFSENYKETSPGQFEPVVPFDD